MSIFTSFAANGDPNNNLIENVYFEDIQKEQPPWKCLDISENIKYCDLPETEDLAFWDEMYQSSSVNLY